MRLELGAVLHSKLDSMNLSIRRLLKYIDIKHLQNMSLCSKSVCTPNNQVKDKTYMKQKVKGMFVVLNDKGLHTRPSTELVKCAANFAAEIELSYRNYVVNAKSILGILMLAAERGSKIVVEAVGEDAEQAISAILRLAQNKFNIKY